MDERTAALGARIAALESEQFEFRLKAMIRSVIKRVAELPDRNSPDDWPEAMLVTGDELAEIVADEVRSVFKED